MIKLKLTINAGFDNEALAQAIVEGVEDPEALLDFLIKCDELVDSIDFSQGLYERLGFKLERELD